MLELIERIRTLASERAEIQADVAKSRSQWARKPGRQRGARLDARLADSAAKSRELDAAMFDLRQIDPEAEQELRAALVQEAKGAK